MRTPSIVWLTLACEGVLVLIALGVGALSDAPPFADLTFAPRNWIVGLLGTAPLVLFLHWSLHTRWPLLARFRVSVQKLIVPMFGDCSPAHLAVVALAAGIGEEALFRGTLQTLAERVLPEPASLLTISILFGLVHAVSGLYVFFAGLFGVYLGVLLLATGSLLPPIIAHGLYDFLALVALLRAAPREGSRRQPRGRMDEHLPSQARIIHNGATSSPPPIPQERDPP